MTNDTATPHAGCSGACALVFNSWRTGESYRAGRVTEACGAALLSMPHSEHDRYSNRAGRIVHCYGA